jgi:superfamily II DNA/RNA helicase
MISSAMVAFNKVLEQRRVPCRRVAPLNGQPKDVQVMLSLARSQPAVIIATEVRLLSLLQRELVSFDAPFKFILDGMNMCHTRDDVPQERSILSSLQPQHSFVMMVSNISNALQRDWKRLAKGSGKQLRSMARLSDRQKSMLRFLVRRIEWITLPNTASNNH